MHITLQGIVGFLLGTAFAVPLTALLIRIANALETKGFAEAHYIAGTPVASAVERALGSSPAVVQADIDAAEARSKAYTDAAITAFVAAESKKL